MTDRIKSWAWGPIILIVLAVAALAYGNYKFFRVVPQDVCADVEESRRKAACNNLAAETFKYGSLGAESDRGIPYPIFHVLPRIFPKHMPNQGRGGYQAFGLPWEEGRELPVGFSKKTMGFERITQNCAVCHTAVYRMKPEDKPTIVPTGPSHTTNTQGFLDFIRDASNDPDFTPDVLMPAIEQSFPLGWDDKLIYRYLLIPIVKQRLQEQARSFAWMHAEYRPGERRPWWGPGRDDPMNLTKFFMLEIDSEKDRTTGNADFPSIWNLGLREGQSLNWGGETQDPLAVIIDSALGLGAPPGPRFIEQMKEIRSFLQNTPPPRYPLAPDANAPDVVKGRALFQRYCGDCHWSGGRWFGKVVPITDIGTDRERFDTWRQQDADKTNEVALEMGVERKPMVKDKGYASQPLDGIWLRAPYLHNGSVPTLDELLRPPASRREAFYRGCDVYDTERMGFISELKPDICPNQFRFDTKETGNGNGGHVYGAELPDEERRALIEYMKTL